MAINAEQENISTEVGLPYEESASSEQHSEQPTQHITLFAEPIAHFGSFTLTNALLTSWVAVAVIIILAVALRSKLREIPSGIQNLFEIIVFENDTEQRPKDETEEEIRKVEEIVNHKIAENLPVSFEMMPLSRAKEIGAIGLFDEKYQNKVKVYFIGGPARDPETSSGRREDYYSVEFCGGPHVGFTGELKKFKISKDESLGKNTRRIYAVVE